jgi:hypothetical protein
MRQMPQALRRNITNRPGKASEITEPARSASIP